MYLENKIKGLLSAAAIGDAMGAATENLSFNQIRKKYPNLVTELIKPGKTAFALGNEAGQVTDDFSQIYCLCNEIITNHGELNTNIVIEAMMKWADMPQYFDRFAGPTTRTAIAMYKDPEMKIPIPKGAVTIDYASKATNGAAMKIAPAAILNPGNLYKAIEDAITITKVTHDNSLAISGACAVAAAASASLEPDSNIDTILTAGLLGAIIGEEKGSIISREVAGPSVVERIKLAYNIVEGVGEKEFKLKKLSDVVGSGLHIAEAVPCSFGIIALNRNDSLQAIFDAVNIGYDTDTIGTIVGTIVGALIDQSNSRFQSLTKHIEKANNFNISKISKSLANVVINSERYQC